jgi:ADP-ribosylglycohydrolase
MDLQNRFLGCLLGLAAGDAVGTTVEFRPRGSFTPLLDMVGGGPFGLQAGQWTDDTSRRYAWPLAWWSATASTRPTRWNATAAGAMRAT